MPARSLAAECGAVGVRLNMALVLAVGSRASSLLQADLGVGADCVRAYAEVGL